MKDNQGVAASPPDHHPFGAEPVPVSGEAGTPNAKKASTLSEWIDRPMAVGALEFTAGQVTIADILDHAAHSYRQKQEQRAKATRKHIWNQGRPGYGVQCKRCGAIAWASLTSDGRTGGNMDEDCPALANAHRGHS